MNPGQLRRALIERGFYEAAALAGADIEAQGVEEVEELDDANVIRADFGASFDREGPEAA
jgi:hypothetical protein